MPKYKGSQSLTFTRWTDSQVIHLRIAIGSLFMQLTVRWGNSLFPYNSQHSRGWKITTVLQIAIIAIATHSMLTIVLQNSSQASGFGPRTNTYQNLWSPTSWNPKGSRVSFTVRSERDTTVKETLVSIDVSSAQASWACGQQEYHFVSESSSEIKVVWTWKLRLLFDSE